jgi:hypothetical protein
MKSFYVNGGLDWHYGQRVFLHESYVLEMLAGTRCFIDQLPYKHHHPVVMVLRKSCVWGGSDKKYGSWLGYEVTSSPEEGQQMVENIRQVLLDEGFIELTECPWK